jgi:hypothetical protein
MVSLTKNMNTFRVIRIKQKQEQDLPDPESQALRFKKLDHLIGALQQPRLYDPTPDHTLRVSGFRAVPFRSHFKRL